MCALLLFDVAVPGGGSGIVFAAVGVAFFFILATIAIVAFWLLRRTVKMAVRMAIISVILIVALAGGVTFIVLGWGSKPDRPRRPEPTRQR